MELKDKHEETVCFIHTDEVTGMSYKFINYRASGSTTVEINEVEIHSILEEFELFLRGCGFVFSGHLDLIDSDETDDFEHEEQKEEA